jgi:hypothetical protein
MTWTRWSLVAALIVMGVVACLVLRRHHEIVVDDLVARFAQARTQPPGAVEVADVTIDGQTKRAIVARGPTRVTYHVTVPDRGWCRVSVALRPDMWTRPGDGVLFFIGISDGHKYNQMTSRVVNPFGHPADRRWREIAIDLTQYAGLTVDLTLNTRAGLESVAGTANDIALWGAPAIVIR